MANQLKIELIVDDKGSVTVKQFGKTLKTETDKGAAGFKKAGDGTAGFSGKLKAATPLVGALGAGLAALGLAQIAKSFWDTGLRVDSMTRSMAAATGGVQEAMQAEKMLLAESERLGLVFKDQIKDYQGIAAAARGTSLEGQKAKDIYVAMAEASTALQMTSSDTSGALNAITQMISKGNVQAEELRGQLGERLPGAFQIAAQAMGTTTAGLSDMLDKGEVVAEDFLPKFAQALRERFAGQVEDSSKSAQANLNRVNNAFFELQRTIMEDVMPAMTNMLGTTADLVKWFTVLAGGKTAIERHAEASHKLYRAVLNYNAAVKRSQRVSYDMTGTIEGYKKQIDELSIALGRQPRFYKQIEKASKAAIKAQAAAAEELAHEELYWREEAYEKTMALYSKQWAERLKVGKESVKAEKKDAADRARMLERFQDDFAKSTMSNYKYELGVLAARKAAYEQHNIDKNLIDQWYASEQQRLWKESETFSATIANNIGASWKNSVNEQVDLFIAGEQDKRNFAEITSSMLSDAFGNTAKQMYAKAIDEIINTIGALLGLGAAGSGGWGAVEGGWKGALARVGLFLGTGIAGMLAGRAMADKFRATGGWIEGHPDGGVIRGGSGTRDDVFLGMTPGVRHWGMGGEFVINKESTRRHRALIEAINADKGMASGGYLDRGYKYGDTVGDPKPVADMINIGGAAAFLQEFVESGNWKEAAVMAIKYYLITFGGAMTAKNTQDKFRARGGIIDVGHGMGQLLDPMGWAEGTDSPFSVAGMLNDFIDGIRSLSYAAVVDVMSPGRMDLRHGSRAFVDYQKEYIRDYVKRIADYSRERAKKGSLFPSFEEGTPYVPRTGPAWLHEGERVVKKEDNVSVGADITINYYNHGVNTSDDTAEWFAEVLEKVNERRIGKGYQEIDISSAGMEM